ncbi:AMP-binding protein [Amycolatopsis panacis]|uniref:AMP-dependent synthetase n=1 Tax=Amycolatopsis panacis TaxID=2340917 RepID=A0A419I2K6_9PSEU|nr:AMP-binding protein [Amycolatopsis panacis]RJQ84185.1 AMP-dependent synthetase [Amycolatopsis panacis]
MSALAGDPAASNLVALLWDVAERDPERLAIHTATSELSFAELRRAAQGVAGALREAGVAPLDRVLLVCPTIAEFPILYYGMLSAGVTVITMNTMSTSSEITHVLTDAEPSLVIAWTGASAAAREAATGAGVPFWEVPAGARFDADPVSTPWAYERDDTALILYTSGTTGKPKGAQITSGNLVANAVDFPQVSGFGPDDRVGTALPLFHVFGQAAVMNTTLAAGGSMFLVDGFDPIVMLELARDQRLTAIAAVPTMWVAMVGAAAAFDPADFTSMRFAGSGGAAIPPEVQRACERVFGCDIRDGYGLSETTGVVTFNDVSRPRRPGSVGCPLPGVQIEIRSSGEVLGVGDVGEIHIRGDKVMKGYWNRPAETGEALVEGWLRTGDLGSLDPDGYLSIVGRAKELIIRGGYNVYPREVEDVLYDHPDILEAAVLGVPDERLGEEVGAVVVLREGAELDVDSLRLWAKERLSAYKVPHVVAFTDHLPKGSTGKILKREIDPAILRL